MSKEFLNNKLLRAAITGAAIVTTTPHFEASAQVNGMQIIDCKTPDGRRNNTANLPILPDEHLPKPGRFVPSITCRDSLTALPGHGQFVDLR